jgi:polyisoprenoid-binding protein YceI
MAALHNRAMSRLHACLAAALLLAGAGSTRAEPASYTFDPSHSFVTFEIDHFGTSTVRGRFGPLSGSAELDREGRRGRVQTRIPTGSVSLGFPAFDSRAREPDLLDSAQQPEAFFVAERFIFEGEAVREVRGELTLRGTSRPLALRALRFNCYLNPLFRREVCGGDFEAELNRSDYGLSFGLPFVGDRVRLLIQVEAIRQ